jgi:hypothetical protein
VAYEEDKRYNRRRRARSERRKAPKAMSMILSSTAPHVIASNQTPGFRVPQISEPGPEWIAQRYDAVVKDAKYFQFANIPDRIIRCLELVATIRQTETMRARLLAYSLFIGVVDDEVELAGSEIGDQLLNRLANPLSFFDEAAQISKAHFMTEILKQHIGPEVHEEVLARFRDLHRTNLSERTARTVKTYIGQRKSVGRLTAEISYLLIRDCVSFEAIDCCRLMKEVGAVGCLLDSVIDTRTDQRSGNISFRPTLIDFLVLSLATFVAGLRIILKYPRMLSLFWEGMRDNFKDRKRLPARLDYSKPNW